MTVFQAVASFLPHDAVAEAARRFRDVLASGSAPPPVIVEGVDRRLADEAVSFRELGAGSSEDVIIYHVSTDSELAEWLADRPERLLLYYHNLTPPEFFEEFDEQAATRLKRARIQLEGLARVADRAAAPSQFSIAELVNYGFRDPMQVPYPVTSHRGFPLKRKLRREGEAESHSGGGREGQILFVGRLTPNKCQHDLIRAFATYRERGGGSRLALVGSTHLPLYRAYLGRYAEVLGVPPEIFVGSVSAEELANRYGGASVFCSLSRHEGFGVPLVEAMALGLPVLALDAAAVAETVGDGGLILNSAEPGSVSAMIERVQGDNDLRLELIEAGTERARELADPARLRRALTALLAE